MKWGEYSQEAVELALAKLAEFPRKASLYGSLSSSGQYRLLWVSSPTAEAAGFFGGGTLVVTDSLTRYATTLRRALEINAKATSFPQIKPSKPLQRKPVKRAVEKQTVKACESLLKKRR